jgi:O-methyltransferase
MTKFLKSVVRQWDSRIGYAKSDPVKKLLKVLAGSLDRGVLSRFLSYSILKSEFENLRNVSVCEERKDVWNKALQFIDSAPLTYIEFGVFEGDSIQFFCSNNQYKDSKFFGLDSFEGLPESWAGNPIGYFTTSGTFPELDDSRVVFVKGYFNQTWNQLFSKISERTNLLVHYDADLYSSTLFALTKIDSLKQEYYAIFDEFSGDEVRALSDYLISYGAKVEFLATQKWRGFPEVVLCRILPLT